METLESSFFYQHLKLLKIQAVSQPSSRGDGGGKGKNRGSAAERGKGQGRGRGGGDSGQMIHCFRCGQGGHMANACNHLKVKDIPKNADGTWPRICHHCFKAGHLRSKCPDLGKKPAAAGGSYYVEVFWFLQGGREKKKKGRVVLEEVNLSRDKEVILSDEVEGERKEEEEGWADKAMTIRAAVKNTGNKPFPNYSVEIAEMLSEEVEDMRIRLPLVVNDLCVEVMYDTGATHSHCDEAWARKYGVRWKSRREYAVTQSGLEVLARNNTLTINSPITLTPINNQNKS